MTKHADLVKALYAGNIVTRDIGAPFKQAFWLDPESDSLLDEELEARDSHWTAVASKEGVFEVLPRSEDLTFYIVAQRYTCSNEVLEKTYKNKDDAIAAKPEDDTRSLAGRRYVVVGVPSNFPVCDNDTKADQYTLVVEGSANDQDHD